MTRARALKHAIRSRAARTGERYTTARRHVLEDRLATTKPPLRTDPAGASRPATRESRSTMSEARFREKTGHGLHHWFAVLDRFGAVEKGHTAAARYLQDVHNVSGWDAQSVTVSYERARGMRAPNQRLDGKYEVSVSKVVAADTGEVIAAFTEARRRRRWVEGLDPEIVAALKGALAGTSSRGFAVKPNGQATLRYKWGGTTVDVYVIPKAVSKSSVVASSARLPAAAMVEERRAQWRKALSALATYLAG